jgi:hypothetical protein
VQDLLVEGVVLPLAGYLQVSRRHPNLLEAGLQQHPLRANIVQESTRLYAVQSEFVTCGFNDYLDRS